MGMFVFCSDLAGAACQAGMLRSFFTLTRLLSFPAHPPRQQVLRINNHAFLMAQTTAPIAILGQTEHSKSKVKSLIF